MLARRRWCTAPAVALAIALLTACGASSRSSSGPPDAATGRDSGSGATGGDAGAAGGDAGATGGGGLADGGSGDAGTGGGSGDGGSAGGGSVEPLFGAAFTPHDATRMATLVQQFGGLEITRSYDGKKGVGPYLNTYQALDLKQGAASAYSFKYLPTDVLAGKDDAALESFFQGIPDNHPVYWTYWHEPDDELYKTHLFTPSDYRAAWAHIRAIADGVKATRPNLEIYATFIIMEYSMRPNIAPSRPLTGPNGMYPGDSVIDVFGVDAYNSGAANGTLFDPATQFGKVIDFAEQHHKPWAIGELGSCPVNGNPNGRAQYLTNAIKYWKSRSDPPVYAAYFDVSWSTCDYTLDADAAATKVWKTAMTQGLKAF